MKAVFDEKSYCFCEPLELNSRAVEESLCYATIAVRHLPLYIKTILGVGARSFHGPLPYAPMRTSSLLT